MAKKISFIILSNSGTTVKQVAVSVVLLTIVLLLSAGGAAFIGIALYDYQSLRQTLAGSQQMAGTIEAQQRLVLAGAT